MKPRIDLTIAVHSAARPIERAVRSVLDHTDAAVRVTVVVHEIDPGEVAARLGDLADDRAVRLLPHSDGLRSPAGPFNVGLNAAESEFVAVMGSDDELQPHALDSWLKTAHKFEADVVIARLKHANGPTVPTPPTRPWRTRSLDGVRDRLSYRSAPLGLISRARFPDLRFTVGVPTGEDIAFTTRLWFADARVSYDRKGPAYLIHDDALDRATLAPRPITEEFGWFTDLVESAVLDTMAKPARQAAIVKFIRIHLFGAILYRPDAQTWTPQERECLAAVSRALIAQGEGIHTVLSRLDRTLLDLALDPGTPNEDLVVAAQARRAFASPGALIPRDVSRVLAREAPLRMAFASALQLR